VEEMMIKCIGCNDLLREELDVGGKKLVVYNCPRFFPYACALSGLLRPSTGILKAGEMCPDDPLSHCVVCSNTKITHYGQAIVSICSKHDIAWGKWLEEHPERRAYFVPKGRVKKANWIEVFREFIEDMRKEAKKC